MATLIGAALLFALAYQAHRVALRLIDRDPSDNPVPRPRFDRHDIDDIARGARPDPGPPTAAERREAELARQLLAGRLDPATYRDRMSELAHLSRTQAGGRR